LYRQVIVTFSYTTNILIGKESITTRLNEKPVEDSKFSPGKHPFSNKAKEFHGTLKAQAAKWNITCYKYCKIPSMLSMHT